MHRHVPRRLLRICFAACSFAGSAAAQSPELAGGGDDSYGAPPSDRDGAALDVRRDVPAQPGGERPDWLERERVGPPYEAGGRWYVPTVEPGYEQTGTASWYGADFQGRRTASGEAFDQRALTGAHPTLPIPSLVQVTNLENGREVIVRINDRGPFVPSRLIDVSRAAAEVLGFLRAGQARVHVRYLGPAPRRVVGIPAADVTAAEPEDQGPASLLPPPARAEPDLAGAPTEMSGGSGGYVVQVGAYADLDNAHRVRDAAGAVGPVTVDVRTTSSGELFRVRVGPWPTRAEADAALRILAALGYADAVVTSR